MFYIDIIKKNNKNVDCNFYIRIFEYYITLTKIINSKKQIENNVLIYIHYLTLKYLEFVFKIIPIDNDNFTQNTNININDNCDDFLIYMLNLKNINEFKLCELLQTCIMSIQKQDIYNVNNINDNYIFNYSNYIDIFNFYSSIYYFKYDEKNSIITFENKSNSVLKQKLNPNKKILKNNIVNELIKIIGFELVYNNFMKSESSNTYEEYKNYFPLENLGNEYINYINEKPTITHDTNYILIKILMLQDFFDIYKNYINTEELKLIDINKIKHNLEIFKNIIKSF